MEGNEMYAVLLDKVVKVNQNYIPYTKLKAHVFEKEHL